VAGLAAFSVLAVQRVLDDTAEVPADPAVRLIDADIAASLIVTEANKAALAGPLVPDFAARCNQLATAFSDVVASVGPWSPPITIPGNSGNPGATPPVPPTPPELSTPAKCPVVPRPDLGGP